MLAPLPTGLSYQVALCRYALSNWLYNRFCDTLVDHASVGPGKRVIATDLTKGTSKDLLLMIRMMMMVVHTYTGHPEGLQRPMAHSVSTP